MSEATFRVLFDGAALPGVDPDTAAANLARLLKREPAQAAALFNGKPLVLKKGVTEADAERLRATLAKAGLAVRVEAEAPAPAPAVEPPRIPANLALVEDDDHRAAAAEQKQVPPMACPACGHEQPRAEVCVACGVVIAKFLQRKAEKERLEAERAAQAQEVTEPAAEAAEKPSLLGKLFGKLKRD